MNDNQYTDAATLDTYQRDHKARCAGRTDLATLTKLEAENAALKEENYRLRQRVMELLGRIAALEGE